MDGRAPDGADDRGRTGTLNLVGKLAPPVWQPPITERTERTDRATIAARLRRVNCEAMEISRRGHPGTRSVDYEVRHATLNILLDHWQMAQR